MLVFLSASAQGVALVMALLAGIFAFQAVPETHRTVAGKQAVATCIEHRAILEAEIPEQFPAWRRDQMARELPDCSQLPRAVWRHRRAKASVLLCIGSFMGFAFAAIAMTAEQLCREVDASAEAAARSRVE